MLVLLVQMGDANNYKRPSNNPEITYQSAKILTLWLESDARIVSPIKTVPRNDNFQQVYSDTRHNKLLQH